MKRVLLVVLAGCTPDPQMVGEGSDVAVEPGPEVRCALPQARTSTPYAPRASRNVTADFAWNWGGGSIVADLDGDGFVEVVATEQPGLVLYAVGPTQEFGPAPQSWFSDLEVTFATGGSAADYDGDGDLDLYLTRSIAHPASVNEPDGRNHLLRNRGDGHFDDVTDEAGVDGCIPHPVTGEESCWASMSSSWGDYDGDGDLDLYIGNYGYVDQVDGLTQEQMPAGDPDALYRNRGDGTFEDVSHLLSLQFHEGWSYAGGFLDLDDDGDLDLYTINDFGNRYPNRVAWNDGGTFRTESDDPSGLTLSMTGMGLGITEWTGDGRPDLAIPQWQRSSLLESSGGRWFDAAAARGFAGDLEHGQQVGWGIEFGDLDNSGVEELVVAFGYLESLNSVWSNARRQPDGVFERRETETGYVLENIAPSLGLNHPGAGRGVSLLDWNRDGWLDVWLRNLDAADVLYTATCGEGHWVELELLQPGSMNRFAVGSKIEVIAGGEVLTRWVTAGGTNFGSAGAPEVHIGLGAASRVDGVRVRWPDGRWSDVYGVEVDRRSRLVRE